MTLSKLIVGVIIAGAILTLITYFVFKKKESVWMSFLQNAVGALFIFSGAVKAVDPLGTAFKMEQYFAEFQVTLADTWFSFLGGLFPILSNNSPLVSLAMIIFEIVLGAALILGASRKLTAWSFALLVIFFTILTGFTYLTGYVPMDATFFDFDQWTSFSKDQMRVQDCGCFGDFLKLEPKTSFYKDVVLLVPALLFVLYYKKKHQLFSSSVRCWSLAALSIGLLIYCLNNFVWDIPRVDFRPFKEGVDIRATKEAEEAAMSNVEILGWSMINESTGQVVNSMNPNYSDVVRQYPKADGWKVKDQIKSEPLIPSSKISEFIVTDRDGDEVSEDLLTRAERSIWIIQYKLSSYQTEEQIMVKDTVIIYDDDSDSTHLEIAELKRTVRNFSFDPELMETYDNIVEPLARDAAQDGVETYVIIQESSPELMADLRSEIDAPVEVYRADDILLKTIIRSNPGILLVEDGKILGKWHQRHVPSWAEIKASL